MVAKDAGCRKLPQAPHAAPARRGPSIHPGAERGLLLHDGRALRLELLDAHGAGERWSRDCRAPLEVDSGYPTTVWRSDDVLLGTPLRPQTGTGMACPVGDVHRGPGLRPGGRLYPQMFCG